MVSLLGARNDLCKVVKVLFPFGIFLSLIAAKRGAGSDWQGNASGSGNR